MDTNMSVDELPSNEIAKGESLGRLRLEDGVGVDVGILLVFPITLR